MARYGTYFWKQTPLFRLIVPFICGIIFQWYIGMGVSFQAIIALVCLLMFLLFKWLPEQKVYKWGWVRGVCIMVLFFTVGAFISYTNNLKNDPTWAGNLYRDSAAVLVTIEEPLVEKQKTYKALATIEAVYINNEWQPVKGKMLLYFKKDSLRPDLQYGSQLMFFKPLQAITNSGNPGSFDYKRFSAFHNIYYQCFLQNSDYRKTNTSSINRFQQWLFQIRFSVIQTLKKYIPDEREQGVAEALLIGYRDDLDKSLVQAYSNTGVVHIIAISGLHLGMIYGTLLWFFKLFKKRGWVKWVKPIVVLLVIWIFSLVAGAAPSILRSAVMFSFLLVGEVMNRKLTAYNTLAASAFTILIINPFALWDVGFQLSYAAVLSIMLFMQPIYKWFYIKNKLLRGIWQLSAVTISAQVLTLPIVCYHFHQFPNLFLVSNFVIVPLASVILYSELFLLFAAHLFEPLAQLTGFVTFKLLWFMNTFIVEMNQLSFAVTDGIQISVLQALLLFVLILSGCFWLMRKNKQAFYISFTCMVLFVVSFTFDLYTNAKQSRLIVYNVPQHTAIDFISGRNYQFAGDDVLLEDDFLRNFHLKPSRVMHRTALAPIEEVSAAKPFYFYNNKRILLVDKPYRFNAAAPVPVDLIILSKNAKVSIAELAKTFSCKLYVFDGANSLWKINQWKKECDNLHLRHYSTQESGALVMDL